MRPSTIIPVKPEGLLMDGLKELAIEPSGELVRSFMIYLTELKKWNRAYSLTSLKTDHDIVVKHFLDSCLYLKAIPEGEIIGTVDVGSGAGFPGLPIKMARPGLSVSLIEPSGKKAAFLRHMVRTLGLTGVKVIEKRVEDVSGDFFDAAVTRALFSVKEFAAKVKNIVRPGGLIILSKGPRFEEEIAGMKDYEVIEVRLPSTGIVRHLVVLKNEVKG